MNELMKFYDSCDERDRRIVNAMFSMCRELGRPRRYRCAQEFVINELKTFRDLFDKQ